MKIHKLTMLKPSNVVIVIFVDLETFSVPEVIFPIAFIESILVLHYTFAMAFVFFVDSAHVDGIAQAEDCEPGFVL